MKRPDFMALALAEAEAAARRGEVPVGAVIA
ncbi:MAG: nucleoside deaminase, partial [Mesorhizobium sp.]